MRRTLIIAGLTFGVSVAGLVLIFSIWPPGQIFGWYEIADRVEVTSPDDTYIASGYHVYGGATVSDMTVIEIGPKWWWFIPQTRHSVLINDMTAPGDNSFGISWKDASHLSVIYTRGSGFSRESNWRDVHIAYTVR